MRSSSIARKRRASLRRDAASADQDLIAEKTRGGKEQRVFRPARTVLFGSFAALPEGRSGVNIPGGSWLGSWWRCALRTPPRSGPEDRAPASLHLWTCERCAVTKKKSAKLLLNRRVLAARRARRLRRVRATGIERSPMRSRRSAFLAPETRVEACRAAPGFAAMFALRNPPGRASPNNTISRARTVFRAVAFAARAERRAG